MPPKTAITYDEWADPRCTGVNKEPAHAALFPFETREAALVGDRVASSRFLSLNSPDAWAFKWFPSVKACLGSGEVAEPGCHDKHK